MCVRRKAWCVWFTDDVCPQRSEEAGDEVLETGDTGGSPESTAGGSGQTATEVRP